MKKVTLIFAFILSFFLGAINTNAQSDPEEKKAACIVACAGKLAACLAGCSSSWCNNLCYDQYEFCCGACNIPD
jgi:hypothetical protein